MELVKRLKDKRRGPKLIETRLGVFSFVITLLTLAYFNIFLIRLDGVTLFSNLFLLVLPVIGVISALLSFTRFNYKKTFAWWALALYMFMLICIVIILFIEFATYTKP